MIFVFAVSSSIQYQASCSTGANGLRRTAPHQGGLSCQFICHGFAVVLGQPVTLPAESPSVVPEFTYPDLATKARRFAFQVDQPHSFACHSAVTDGDVIFYQFSRDKA
jgi:hypothetical protein